MADYPALPLWTDAYLADTMHLNCTESGAYLHLLISAWRTPDCSLPNDDKKLALFAKCTPRQWKTIRPVLEEFFTISDNIWLQKRLTRERLRVSAIVEQRKTAGKASALKRKETGSTPVATPLPNRPTEPPTGEPRKISTHNQIHNQIHNDPLNGEDADDKPRENPATEIIRIFDRKIIDVYGPAQQRAYPAAKDITVAQELVDAGATPEIAGPAIEDVLRNKIRSEEYPPTTLSYVAKAVKEAIAKHRANDPVVVMAAAKSRAAQASLEILLDKRYRLVKEITHLTPPEIEELEKLDRKLAALGYPR